jgi:hypothetical protein
MLPDLQDTETPQDNYPHEDDSGFTPDQKEVIIEFKNNLKKKRDKNDGIKNGLEAAFWNISLYSVARFMVLTVGLNGVPLAWSLCVVSVGIINRDCLESFNFDRKDGEFQILGMGKLLKFIISASASSYIVFTATADISNFKKNSEDNYRAIQEKIDEYNRMPETEQNKELMWIVLGAGISIAVISMVKGKS